MKVFEMDESFDWANFDPSQPIETVTCEHGADEASCGACLQAKLQALLGE